MFDLIVFSILLAAGVFAYIYCLIDRGPNPALIAAMQSSTPSQSKYGKCESPIERKLYNALTFNGYVVYTQHKVGPYRGDLFIKPNLIIECDGKAYHLDKARDRRRDRYIRSQGYSVIRFSGSRINGDIKGVVLSIEKKLQKQR